MGMASVNQTQPHCVNQMGKTHSKPLAARHGRGMAWTRHAVCESTLNGQAAVKNGLTDIKHALVKCLHFQMGLNTLKFLRVPTDTNLKD